jgi:hypothetical protein
MKTLELYIISNEDLAVLSVCQPCSYNINLDEETNGKSTFILPSLNNAKKGYYAVLNGLYKQFIFKIDDVITNKNEKTVTIIALDISNIFDRKIIARNLETMTENSLEDFIADTILENFVNSDDAILNIPYIDVYVHTNTQVIEPTNEENGLYNFHTFITNCRQNKNIHTDFKFENGRMRIDIENKTESTVLIDTTVSEVTGYNKIYDADPVARVQVYIREDNSEYNLYLRTDRTTTTDKNDVNRARGRIEVISVDTLDNAHNEALNVMRGNRYHHLVEFKISKTSKLVDVTQLQIGTPIKVKTEDDVYDSYISAIAINNNDNFIYYKSGNLRIDLIDKLKQEKSERVGNKLDVSGGKVRKLTVSENLNIGEKSILDLTYPVGAIYMSVVNTNPATLFGGTWVEWGKGRVPVGVDTSQTEFNTVEKTGGAKTHTLTANQLPKIIQSWPHGDPAEPVTSYADVVSYGGWTNRWRWVGALQSFGNDQPHNNLQPYITCYMWKRTA